MTTPPRAASDALERELLISRVFDAPRELVWSVWTDREHISNWWGPRGFSTTTERMDPRPGGEWRFVMHGPDGRDYVNRVEFIEVAPPERLVYIHGGEGDPELEPVNFHVTVTFEEHRGKTRLTLRMAFASKEEQDRVVAEYGAAQGAVEMLDRLADFMRALG